MFFEIAAIVCTALFTGAAAYITFVEHPARMACGTAVALKQFGPSYRRATVMQVLLAAVGLLSGTAAWLSGRGVHFFVAALLLVAVIPFTLIVIFPTNNKLLDPGLDPSSAEALVLLRRWGSLHAVRTLLSAAALTILLANLPR